ncbi:MAG TPA: DUF5985 family protein [Thermoanaerobaculia bacterium]|nr:DUF5985 family protein [Thermoanaerobaculia bacterium]
MIGLIVYGLCVVTSALCAVLLLRGYARSRVPLLLWSGLCFIGLTLNNLLLFVDVQIAPMIDLSTWRTLPALVGVLLLLYGMIWETR